MVYINLSSSKKNHVGKAGRETTILTPAPRDLMCPAAVPAGTLSHTAVLATEHHLCHNHLWTQAAILYPCLSFAGTGAFSCVLQLTVPFMLNCRVLTVFTCAFVWTIHTYTHAHTRVDACICVDHTRAHAHTHAYTRTCVDACVGD